MKILSVTLTTEKSKRSNKEIMTKRSMFKVKYCHDRDEVWLPLLVAVEDLPQPFCLNAEVSVLTSVPVSLDSSAVQCCVSVAHHTNEETLYDVPISLDHINVLTQ